MKKVIIAVIIVLLVVGGVLAVSNFNNPSTDNIQIIAAIYPLGTYDESYCFTLYDDNSLIVEKGRRNLADDEVITNPSFIKGIKKRKTKSLSDTEVAEILSLADKTSHLGVNTDFAFDSWQVQVIYKGNAIMNDYHHDIPPELKELIDKFIEISPLEIDIHGWA